VRACVLPEGNERKLASIDVDGKRGCGVVWCGVVCVHACVRAGMRAGGRVCVWGGKF